MQASMRPSPGWVSAQNCFTSSAQIGTPRCAFARGREGNTGTKRATPSARRGTTDVRCGRLYENYQPRTRYTLMTEKSDDRETKLHVRRDKILKNCWFGDLLIVVDELDIIRISRVGSPGLAEN